MTRDQLEAKIWEIVKRNDPADKKTAEIMALVDKYLADTILEIAKAD